MTPVSNKQPFSLISLKWLPYVRNVIHERPIYLKIYKITKSWNLFVMISSPRKNFKGEIHQNLPSQLFSDWVFSYKNIKVTLFLDCSYFLEIKMLMITKTKKYFV